VKGTFAEFLRFTAPVKTPYPENNLVNARWFPARGRRAIVLLPHWNADAIAYVSLCKVLNMLGISVLRLTMPYHDIRMPAEISRADYAVSANIGRTLDAVRQGVVDVRCCLDWLQQQGCESWELWAPVWVHVMPSSRRRMIRAFAWLRLIMLPLMLPMWCGMDSRRGTSGREWNRRSLWKLYGSRGWR